MRMDASWMRAVKHGINQSGRLEAQSVRTGKIMAAPGRGLGCGSNRCVASISPLGG